MIQSPHVHVILPANEYIAMMTTLRELTASLGTLAHAPDEARRLPGLAGSAYALCGSLGARMAGAPVLHAWIVDGRITETRPHRKEAPT